MSEETSVPAVVISPVSTEPKDKPDELAGFLSKVVVGYFVGPKVATLLAQVGIQVDPALATIALAGLIHKIHVFAVERIKSK